jgi:ribosomal protein S18 acetylase RimI-like enzyme
VAGVIFQEQVMAELNNRAASLSDIKDIWGLMRQVATDVPFDVESEAAQENILTEVMACCTAGLSPVSIGADDKIVGALLLRRDDFDWGFRNGEALHISYAAVAPTHRDEGVLKALVSEVQQRRVPLYISIKSGNQSGLAGTVKELGFVHESKASNEWGDLYKWQPPAH